MTSGKQTKAAKPPPTETSGSAFEALRALLLPYRAHFSVVHDVPGHFYANCAHADAKGKPQFFGAVKTSGRKHLFHLMPVYDFPELLADVTPALKKRMQGKSCFNFEVVDPALTQELGELVVRGVRRYQQAGKL